MIVGMLRRAAVRSKSVESAIICAGLSGIVETFGVFGTATLLFRAWQKGKVQQWRKKT